MNFFWRTLFIQLLIYLLMVFLGYFVTFYQKHYGMTRNNQWVYNIAMVFEVSFLFLAAQQILKRKVILFFLFVVFLITFSFSILIKGASVFAQYAYVVAGISITFIFLLLLYQIFIRFKTTKEQLPYIFVCAGLIVYFACIVPYFSIINFLSSNYPDLSNLLFNVITDILSNIRYLGLGIALWLIRRNAISKPHMIHGRWYILAVLAKLHPIPANLQSTMCNFMQLTLHHPAFDEL